MLVSDILKNKGSKVFVVSEDTPLSAAILTMHERKIGALVVEDANGRLTGMFSEREAVAALATWKDEALERAMSELMVTPVVTAHPTDPVQEIMTIMTRKRLRHLPVMEGGFVVGIVSIGDIVNSRLAEKIQENQILQDIARWPRVA